MSEMIVSTRTKTCANYIPDYTPHEQQTHEAYPYKSHFQSHHARMHSRYPIEIDAIISWQPWPERDGQRPYSQLKKKHHYNLDQELKYIPLPLGELSIY